jgi:hypothetical protein
MDKLYSKQILIIKAVFCFLLSPLYSIFSYLIEVENAFLYVVLSLMPIACVYTIPFWVTLTFIKKYRVSKISKYAKIDLLSVTVQSFMGVLTSEVIYIISNGTSQLDGIVTLMLSAVFVLIALVFWLLYYVFSYKQKNRP